MNKFLILPLLLGALYIGVSALTPKPVTLSVTPSSGFEPLHVRGIVKIDPNENNREGCITYVGTEFFTQSCKPLDGKDEPKIQEINMVLPAGEYDISIVLYRVDGTTAQSNVAHVKVISKSGVGHGEGGTIDARRVS